MILPLKRCACLLLAVAVVLILCCCEIKTTQERIDTTNVVSIAFVNAEPGGKYETYETLDPDLHQDFWNQFFQLTVYEYWNDPIDTAEGDAILLQFIDGSFCLITHNCTEYFEKGKSKDTRQYYRKDSFGSFWNSFCSYAYEMQE